MCTLLSIYGKIIVQEVVFINKTVNLLIQIWRIASEVYKKYNIFDIKKECRFCRAKDLKAMKK